MLLTGEAALLLSAAVAPMVAQRRTQRAMDSISADLLKINDGERLTRLSEPPYPANMAGFVDNLNTTLEMCDRLRWFALAVSHELRTPLAALRVELEEARLHPDQTDVRQLVDRALRNLDRAEAVVTDMLLLARVQAGKDEDRERFDLGKLVREEIGMRGVDLFPIGLRLADGVKVKAIREQIGQVLTNLLNNAQRHAHHSVEVEVCRKGDMAQLSVNDDGAGIPKADWKRVFDRFARLNTDRRPDQGGAGLGLAISRAIAQVHNGSIHVEESPNGGARFVFRLPAA